MNQTMSGELEPALLPAGTLLHRCFVIDGALAQDSYGAAYSGHDEKTGTPIAIREYFPSALAVRAGEHLAVSPRNKACGALLFLGSEMFYKQYQALTEAKGSDNLVSVYATFFENGTSYAVTEQLEGVTLERYLQLRRRRLFADEAMYIAASMADALLVLHSLNTLHFDISARSIFLCTNGSVKLTDFGAAKASLRARREVDDSDPWIDFAAIARTLYEAMTGQAVFDETIQPHANIPPQMFGLFREMIETHGYRRISSVFEYRHALACVEVGAVYPDVTLEDVNSQLPLPRRQEPRERLQAPQDKPEPVEPEQKRTMIDRALDAMETAVTTDRRATDEKKAEKERQIKRKVGIIYAGILVGVLILAFILRGLIK